VIDPAEHRRQQLARYLARLRAGVSPDAQRWIIREMFGLCHYLRIGIFDYLSASTTPVSTAVSSSTPPTVFPTKSPTKPPKSRPGGAPPPLPAEFPAHCGCGYLCTSKESWYAHQRKHRYDR